MAGYLFRRIFQAVLILLGVSFITFVLLYVLPADPVRQIAGRAATAQELDRIIAIVDDDVEVVVVGRDVSDRDALAAAVDADFARGARAVAAITARSPTLPSYLLDHAFRALQFEPVVVGPTADAGTWLVGIQRGCAAAPPPLAVPQALASGDDVSALALLPFWYLIPDVVTDAAAWLWHIAGSRRGDAAADATLSVLRRPR